MSSVHKHPVYDTDLHLIIDPVTRDITNTSGKVVLMQYDHNSERFTFEIPRYIDGHDMSLCNVVEFHYINVDSANKSEETPGIYPVDDLQISPDSDDVVIGSWLISGNATNFSGSLNFIIRFACVDEETSEITYQWFTNVYSLLKVSKGIYNVNVITEDNSSDLLTSWKNEIVSSVQPYFDALSQKLVDTEFSIDVETGELLYQSNTFDFSVNEETGDLEWEVR